MKFDQKIIGMLRYYVYVLIDPRNKTPFYIGKGKEQRVFQHLACALTDDTTSAKYDLIREIKRSGLEPINLIIRHDLDEKTAFEIESALIDFAKYSGYHLTNLVLGHKSVERGLMTAKEIIRLYNAKPLNKLGHQVVIININKTYKRGTGSEGIYLATKESWVVSAQRRVTTEYAFAEYRGLIVEVYQISDWYPVDTLTKSGKKKIRWGFNAEIAPATVRAQYINKSVAHLKRPGAANPIRYNLTTVRD